MCFHSISTQNLWSRDSRPWKGFDFTPWKVADGTFSTSRRKNQSWSLSFYLSEGAKRSRVLVLKPASSHFTFSSSFFSMFHYVKHCWGLVSGPWLLNSRLSRSAKITNNCFNRLAFRIFDETLNKKRKTQKRLNSWFYWLNVDRMDKQTS